LEADALFFTRRPDIRWACGFTGSNAILLVAEEEAHFVTDGRYSDQARQEVDGAEVHVTRDGLLPYLKEHGLLAPYDRVAVQADDLTVARYNTLQEQLSDVQWAPAAQVLTRLLASKDETEVDRIRNAQAITERVFEEVVDLLSPGMTERAVAAQVTYRHLKHGADTMAFPPIVASGPHAAQPHARPTDRELQEGDMVVLDMGCFHDGYASDMTRTVAVGEPGNDARRAYEVVRRAQAQALAAAQAGMTGEELDAEARTVIEEAGFGEYFSHSLGHGIGLEVHEWPRVSHRTDDTLPEGACVTIEPGVYVPERGYGIRIEDIVVLRPDGAENLTATPKTLLTV
jgi:Xaa-Pro aminopeptidase